MPDSWQEALLQRGAHLADGAIRFEHTAAPETALRVFDLSHLGLIAIRGADAQSFLQGQLTNDVRELSPAHAHLSGHCSHKGRLLACGTLLHRDETYYWQLPGERIAPLLKRLGMFVLRAQVQIEDASMRLARLGVSGDEVAAQLTALGLSVPAHPSAMCQHEQITVMRLADVIPRVELLGPVEDITALWDQLSPEAIACDGRVWHQRDLLAGIPQVYDATAEAFVPQMLNLQLLDGMSFTKGCYTGQEVAARMQHLGTLKRRMYLAEIECEQPPAPGEELHADDSRSRQASGRVVDVSALDAEAGRYLLLVVAEISALEADKAVRLGEQGPQLRFRPLPYELPAHSSR